MTISDLARSLKRERWKLLVFRERKFIPKFFCTPPLGLWTSARSGHGCECPNACFSSKVSRACLKFLNRMSARITPECPQDIRHRISVPKTFSLGCFLLGVFRMGGTRISTEQHVWASWTSAPSGQGRPRKKTLFSCTPSDGVKVFGPGRPAGYPPGRPQDIQPKNFMFRLLFRF